LIDHSASATPVWSSQISTPCAYSAQGFSSLEILPLLSLASKHALG
jgi:hypothetical protein